MAAMRRRQREKDKAKREAQRQKQNVDSEERMMRRLKELSKLEPIDSDAESERCPSFRPNFEISALKMKMQLGWASMAVRRKSNKVELKKIAKRNADTQDYLK